MIAPPLVIDVWLDRTASADNNTRSTAIRTAHAEVMFRFPAEMSAEEKAEVCAYIEAAFRQRKQMFAADAELVVPTQGRRS